MSARSDAAEQQRIRDTRARDEIRGRFVLWLNTPKVESDGGYAPVGQESLDELHALIMILIEARWETDEDGDLPVEFRLVNRNTFQRLHFQPVPYGSVSRQHQNLHPDSIEALLLDAKEEHAHTLNLGLAVDEAHIDSSLMNRLVEILESKIADRDLQDRPAFRGRREKPDTSES